MKEEAGHCGARNAQPAQQLLRLFSQCPVAGHSVQDLTARHSSLTAGPARRSGGPIGRPSGRCEAARADRRPSRRTP
jgi:hypothetical protein